MKCRVALTLVLLWGVGSALGIAADTRVSLPERATVNGARILLGDIARIDTADPELSKRLTEVLVGLAPLPGSSRTLLRGEIVQALYLAGLSPSEVSVEGADAIQLSRASQRVREGDVASLLRSELGARLDIPPQEIVLTSIRFVDPPNVGGGTIELRVDGLERAALNAPTRARLVVFLDGIPSTQLEVEAVASLRSSVQAGAALPDARRPRPRRKPRLVRSGQPVQIALEGPGMRISASGKARASGGLGDEVAVENVISGNVIRCVVTGEGQVQVRWSPVSGLREVSIQ